MRNINRVASVTICLIMAFGIRGGTKAESFSAGSIGSVQLKHPIASTAFVTVFEVGSESAFRPELELTTNGYNGNTIVLKRGLNEIQGSYGGELITTKIFQGENLKLSPTLFLKYDKVFVEFIDGTKKYLHSQQFTVHLPSVRTVGIVKNGKGAYILVREGADYYTTHDKVFLNKRGELQAGD